MNKNISVLIKNRLLLLPLLAAVFISVMPVAGSGQNAISFNKDGWEHYKKGDYFQAIFSFKNALNKNSRYREALIGLGRSFYEVEAYKQSYDLFNRALKLDGESDEAQTGMGFALIGLGNYSGAMDHFKKAVSLSEGKIDAHYGIAFLYNIMGKRIWAKRKLKTIFRMNPYHFESLLLMAEIKSSENRSDEARAIIEKAIEVYSESPKGYAKFGEILLHDYLRNEDEDDLVEAVDALKNALSIQPKSYHASRIMGNISLIKKDYETAVESFSRAIKDYSNGSLYYSLAVAYDHGGDKDKALKSYLRALKLSSSDSILQNKLEDFLVFEDYKIGHPVRIMLNKENLDVATIKSRKNMPDQVVMYLRRALLMNPMDREAREKLMDYYMVNGYYRLYINELKELQNSFEDGEYRNKLTVAIMKRRDKMYHEEGYSVEMPPRDVPRVFVLNFDADGMITIHPDCGEVIASSLSFALGQFGRMRPVGIRKRRALSCGLKCGGAHLYRSVKSLEELVKKEMIPGIDYVVYGTFMEKGSTITLNVKVLDNSKGFLIGEFSLDESGKESLPVISLRSARKIYNMIPFKGRVLKLKEKGIIVNLGLFDGIDENENLVVYKFLHSPGKGYKNKRKILFKVKKADTFVAYAEAQHISDLDLIDSQDIVYPLKKRRAKRIE